MQNKLRPTPMGIRSSKTAENYENLKKKSPSKGNRERIHRRRYDFPPGPFAVTTCSYSYPTPLLSFIIPM